MEKELTETKVQSSEYSLEAKKYSMACEVLKKDVKQLQSDKEKLYGCVRLLARGIRPLKEKIQDYRLQKRLTVSQLKYKETQLKELQATIVSLASPYYSSSAGKAKTSLRAAVIAVMAFNRLCKMANPSVKRSFVNFGSEKLALVPTSQISTRQDIHLSVKEGEASFFSQLCTQLDSLVDESAHNPYLLYSLQKGYFTLSTRFPKNPKTLLMESMLIHDAPSEIELLHTQKSCEAVQAYIKEVTTSKTSLLKRVSEASEDIAKLQQRIFEFEDAIEKKHDVIQFMENRIQTMHDEVQYFISLHLCRICA